MKKSICLTIIYILCSTILLTGFSSEADILVSQGDIHESPIQVVDITDDAQSSGDDEEIIQMELPAEGETEVLASETLPNEENVEKAAENPYRDYPPVPEGDGEELELGVTYRVNPKLVEKWSFTAKETGDYRLHYVFAEDTISYATFFTTEQGYDPLDLDVRAESGNFVSLYFEAGHCYGFNISDIVLVTLTKEDAPSIEIDEKTGPASMDYDSLYKFVAPVSGTYLLKAQGEPGKLNFRGVKHSSVILGYGDDDGFSEEQISLSAGQRCYVAVRFSSSFEINLIKENYMRADVEYISVYDPELYEGSVFKIDKAALLATANSELAKPYLFVRIKNSNFSEPPILRNSSGKIIPWKQIEAWGDNRKEYAAKIEINGASKQYTIEILTNSNDKINERVYTLGINVASMKPTGFRAKAAISSDSIILRWNKATDTSGYKVYRSTQKDSGYRLVKTIKSGSSTGCMDKNLTNGKTYYYKLVPYRTIAGKDASGIASDIVWARVRK